MYKSRTFFEFLATVFNFNQSTPKICFTFNKIKKPFSEKNLKVPAQTKHSLLKSQHEMFRANRNRFSY